jgi:hypothetical protein
VVGRVEEFRAEVAQLRVHVLRRERGEWWGAWWWWEVGGGEVGLRGSRGNMGCDTFWAGAVVVEGS